MREWSWRDGVTAWLRGWPWIAGALGLACGLTGLMIQQEAGATGRWRSEAVLLVSGSGISPGAVGARLQSQQLARTLGLQDGERITARARPKEPTMLEATGHGGDPARARAVLTEALSQTDGWVVALTARGIRRAWDEVEAGVTVSDPAQVIRALREVSRLFEPPLTLIDTPSPAIQVSPWTLRRFVVPVLLALVASYLLAAVRLYLRVEAQARGETPDRYTVAPTPR